MSKRKFFVWGLGTMIILGFLDLLITWILAPNLNAEGNALVAKYGFGWGGLIVFTLATIIFVAIPFYYYCFVFDYPQYSGNKKFSAKYLRNYFFSNHKNTLISIFKAVFNGVGFCLFWWYVIVKSTAIVHNLIISTRGEFSELSFARRVQIMNWVDNILLVIAVLVFLFRILQKPKVRSESHRINNSVHYVLILLFFLLFLSYRIFVVYAKDVHLVKLNYKVDPDIILVNIGESDRSSIARMISTVDSCQPTLMAFVVIFRKEMDTISDSLLIESFKHAKNEILAYEFDSVGLLKLSHEKFRKHISGEGLISRQKINGLVTKFIPMQEKYGILYESLAMKIAKQWKHGIRTEIKVNQSVSIEFARALDQYLQFDGSKLSTRQSCEAIKNKIVLFGYTGPGDQDKYFTPLRLIKEFNLDEADTYSLVILANEIRTILNYQIED